MQQKIRYDIVVLSLILPSVLLLLSAKVKTPGEAALRPFHYAGIWVLFFVAVRSLPVFTRWLKQATAEARVVSWGLVALYAYMMVKLFGMPDRAFKDFVIGGAVDWGLLLGLGAACIQGRKEGRDVIGLVALVVFFVTLACTLLAWFMYYDWVAFRFSEILFTHNPVWGKRIHGWFGDPTQLGAATGLGAIAGLYLLARCNGRWSMSGYLLALALIGSGLYGSGSRNALLSTGVALVILLVHMKRRRGVLTSGIVMIFIVGAMFAQTAWTYKQLLQNSSIQNSSIQNSSKQNSYFQETLRIGDANSMVRFHIWDVTFARILVSEPKDMAWGAGNGHQRLMYGSVFNEYLESLVDFGAIWVLALLAYLAYLYRRLLAIVVTRDDDASRHAAFAMALLSFAALFACNLPSLFPRFFHFADFALILAVVIAAVLIGEGHGCSRSRVPAQ